jgi:hypothetical protein
MKAKRLSEVILRSLHKKRLEPEMALAQTTVDESNTELVTHPAGTFCNRSPRLHRNTYHWFFENIVSCSPRDLEKALGWRRANVDFWLITRRDVNAAK